MNKAIEILLAAKNPLIATGYSGKHFESVAALAKLAETLAARVISGQVRMNFPTTHPLFTGMEGSRTLGKYFTEADAILVIDYDPPYAAGPTTLNKDTRVIYLDLDTQKKTLPLWNHPAEVIIEADSGEAIPALQKIAEKKLTPELQNSGQPALQEDRK